MPAKTARIPSRASESFFMRRTYLKLTGSNSPELPQPSAAANNLTTTRRSDNFQLNNDWETN
jgi:hypothetical protein